MGEKTKKLALQRENPCFFGGKIVIGIKFTLGIEGPKD